MDKKTFVITTDQNSDCEACMSPILCKYDYIQFRSPASVIAMNGHEKLYDEDALDRARRAGEDAAWNLAQKILELPAKGGYSTEELVEIFGKSCCDNLSCLIRDRSFHEVASKIQKWEEEIRVGDVVKLHWGGEADHLAVVTWAHPDSKLLSILLDNGNVGDIVRDQCVKIDKKLNIAALLVELNGKEEN